jgi:CelD/BcsL family acetyltransferase involved in cellulose biosynthesis
MSMTESNSSAFGPPSNGDGFGHPVNRVRAVALADVGPDGMAAWTRLADRAAEPNPFFRPELVQAAARTHGREPVLLVATCGDEWALCLPVARAARWRRVMVPALVPWMPIVSFLSVPLADPARLDEAAWALASFLAAERRDAALVLDPIDPDAPVGRALGRAFARIGTEPIEYARWQRAALRRRPQPTYLEEAMSGKRRKELRRLHRALGRELGGEPVTLDRSGDPHAWDEFLALERDGWKGQVGTAMASTPEGAAFFRAMCQTAAHEGRLQLLALEVAGRTAAMQCNLVDGGVVFGFKVAYDESLARFSPGALLEVDAFRVFHETPSLTSADSCASPDSELVNRIWPDRRRLQTLIVPTRSRRAALIGPNIAAEAAGRKVVRVARARLRARRADTSASS